MKSGVLLIIIGLGFIGFAAYAYTIQLEYTNTSAQFSSPTPIFIIGFIFLLLGGGAIGVARGNQQKQEQALSTSNTKSNKPGLSLEAELSKLNDMKQRGVIDEAEYKRLRDNLINRS